MESMNEGGRMKNHGVGKFYAGCGNNRHRMWTFYVSCIFVDSRTDIESIF